MAGDCDYLHFSTHAVPENDMPLFSRLILEPTATDDGNLTVPEIIGLGLKTKLVTLSACETGRSFPASGNEFVEQDRLGLIEAFLHAGSGSVLASLFPVSDRSTTEFMKSFYSHLGESDKAEALAQTQRTMIRGEEFSHPRYWSPFILVGSIAKIFSPPSSPLLKNCLLWTIENSSREKLTSNNGYVGSFGQSKVLFGLSRGGM